MMLLEILILLAGFFLILLVLLWLLMPLMVVIIKRSLGREILVLRRILKELKSVNAQMADFRNKAAIKPEAKAEQKPD